MYCLNSEHLFLLFAYLFFQLHFLADFFSFKYYFFILSLFILSFFFLYSFYNLFIIFIYSFLTTIFFKSPNSKILNFWIFFFEKLWSWCLWRLGDCEEVGERGREKDIGIFLVFGSFICQVSLIWLRLRRNERVIMRGEPNLLISTMGNHLVYVHAK